MPRRRKSGLREGAPPKEMSRRGLTLKQKADELEGHFKWLQNVSIKHLDIGAKIDYLETWMELEPHMRMVYLAFLSYLYTRESDYFSFSKALETVDRAESIDPSSIPYFVDCSQVIKANKICILLLWEERNEASTELENMERIFRQSQSDEKTAILKGTQAWTLSEIGTNKERQEGVKLSKNAIHLSPKSPNWHFLAATLMHEVSGMTIWTKPSDEIINHMDAACRFSNNTIPIYLIRYAFYYAQATGSDRDHHQARTPAIRSATAKCKSLIRQATEAESKHPGVFNYASKASRSIGDFAGQKIFLELGVAQCDKQVRRYLLLPLARLYFKNKREKNLPKALALCKEAMDRKDKKASLSAKYLMIEIKLEMDPAYDPCNDCAEIFVLKNNEQVWDNWVIPSTRGILGKYYMQNGQIDNAIENFLQGIEEEQSMTSERLAKNIRDSKLIETLKLYIAQNPSTKLLEQLAYFYCTLKPTPTQQLKIVQEKFTDEEHLKGNNPTTTIYKHLSESPPSKEELVQIYDELTKLIQAGPYSESHAPEDLLALRNLSQAFLNLREAEEAYKKILTDFPDYENRQGVVEDLVNVLLDLKDGEEALIYVKEMQPGRTMEYLKRKAEALLNIT